MITLARNFNEAELWEAIVGCDFTTSRYWVSSFNLDWEDEWSSFPVTHLSKEDEGEQVTTTVTKEMLLSGLEKMLNAKQTHCGSYPMDYEDYDACFGDFVLQYAIFGEMIYS